MTERAQCCRGQGHCAQLHTPPEHDSWGEMAAAEDVGATVSDETGSRIPPDFICPITQEIMRDPVIALDGHSYERTAITQWFGLGRIKSPLTNAPLG